MARYRSNLPQLGDEIFLTDGGIETSLIFHDGLDLPHFASFVLLEDDAGVRALRRYYERYLDLAPGNGFVLESPTWRSNPDWGACLGYDAARLASVNRRAIELMAELRTAVPSADRTVVISGCVGPRGDGYVVGDAMSAEQAADYHAAQIEAFAGTEADMVSAITMTHPQEAAGIAMAARSFSMPVALSFTTETDGRLPSGQTLAEAIEQVDATSGGGPDYYMINCAHPDHFADVLESGAAWTDRIRGIRANASRMSHAELDEAETLDEGDPCEFGGLYATLRKRLPKLSVLGGCCGTDHRHIQQAFAACTA